MACIPWEDAKKWTIDRAVRSRVVDLATREVKEELPPYVLEEVRDLDESARIVRGYVAEAMGFKLEDFEGEA
ncbi:hypothetical protein D3C84_1254230 [compost metagenome]